MWLHRSLHWLLIKRAVQQQLARQVKCAEVLKIVFMHRENSAPLEGNSRSTSAWAYNFIFWIADVVNILKLLVFLHEALYVLLIDLLSHVIYDQTCLLNCNYNDQQDPILL